MYLVSHTLKSLRRVHHETCNWNGGLSIGGRKISNLRYEDDTTLVVTNVKELIKLLVRVKVESEALRLRLYVTKRLRS